MKTGYVLRLYDHNLRMVGQKLYENKRDIIHKVKDILQRYQVYGTPLYATMKELQTGIKVAGYMKRNKVHFSRMK